MSAYYNEIDPFAAAWLRELIKAGLIADGEVDTRSILDVRASELRRFTQCHFFAGIGGWSLAFRIAGWSDKKRVWSGSCPCQPLSGAGQRKGHADERHLWPAFYDLISECDISTVFGEQVASDLGREWCSGIRADLEILGHAFGAADLCAASVGSPNIRQRLFWVAYAKDRDGRGGECREEATIGTDGIRGGGDLQAVALLAGWGTPKVTLGDWQGDGKGGKILNLSGQAKLAGWATPKERDFRSEHGSQEMMERQDAHTRGKDLNKQALFLSSARMESGGESPRTKLANLNPRFSLWLMLGPFAIVWACCGEAVMLSTRGSGQNSSKLPKK